MLLLASGPLSAQRDPARLSGLDGGELTQAALEGGHSVIIFWAGWSPKGRDIVERVNQIHSKWNDRARVLTINFQEDEEDVREFLSSQRMKAPVYLDSRGAFSKKHAVTDLPGLVIYKDGRVAYRGKLPRDADALIARTLG